MMKNSTDKSLNQKLKAYSAVAGSFLISGNVANASIVYKDINPDTVVAQTVDGSQSYMIDINNDGLDDFSVMVKKGVFYGPYAYVMAYGLNPGNAFMASDQTVPGASPYPVALGFATTIDTTSKLWSNSGYLAGKFSVAQGKFFDDGKKDKMLGIRFTIGSDITHYHYGWIRIDVSANGDLFTVYDFAYETAADTKTSTPKGATVLTIGSASNITANSATCKGKISADGGAPIIDRGVCWSTSSGPTILNNKTSDGTGTGSFTSSITGLAPGTKYYVRSFATNISGTTYGSEVSFTTTAVTSINNSLSANTIIKNINNILTVEFPTDMQGEMELINMSGMVVRSAGFNGQTWELNIQDMMKDIYMVRISSNEGYLVKKVLVY